MQETTLLDRNGNRLTHYLDCIRDVVSLKQPVKYVEVGVGVGHSLIAAHSVQPKLSSFAVDLFGRKGPIDQLNEFHDNIKHAEVRTHAIRSPGDFPAQAYPKKHLDMVHIDILDDPNMTNAEHLVRLMITAWWQTTKTMMLPNEGIYRKVVEGRDLAFVDFGGVILIQR